MPPLLFAITDVEYLGEYRLKLTFNNGETRVSDLEPYLTGEVFGPLRDRHEFIQFGLTDTIEWANGADLAPEFLYDIGVPA